MLISKPMPEITWSLITAPDPAGDWVFVNSPNTLTDGNPRIRCRIAGPDSTDLIAIQANFAKPIRPRMFACLSRGPTTAEPELRVLGRAVGSGVFDIQLVPAGSAPFVAMPNGYLNAFYVSTNTVQVDAVQISVGPAENVDPAHLDIGDILIAEAFEVCITRDWSEQLENLSKSNETRSGQDFPSEQPSRRIASVEIAPVSHAKAITDSDSLKAIQKSLSGLRPVLVVPMLRAPGLGKGAQIDQDTVRESALFGRCVDLGSISIVNQSSLYRLGLKFRETPG